MGNFDDLVPNRGNFDDLIPKNRDPSLKEKIFDVPSAAIRSAIQGKGYARGAVNFRNVPKFQDIALNKYYDKVDTSREAPFGMAGVIGSPRASAGLIPSAAGYALDTATNPAELALMFGGEEAVRRIAPTTFGKAAGKVLNYPIEKVPDLIRFNRVGGKTGALKKASESLIKVLQPSTRTLDVASGKGFSTPEDIQQTLPFVRKVKDYEDLAGQLRQSKIRSAKVRNERIRGENFKVGEEFLTPLRDEIAFLERQPQTESTIRDITKLRELESVYSQKYGSGISRTKAQAVKERLQKETEPLLKKVSAGLSTELSPTEIKGLDKIRSGLMKAVEGGDPKVSRLNNIFKALKSSEALAVHQSNLAKKAPDPTLLERIPVVKDIINLLMRRPDRVALELYIDALRSQRSLPKTTKEIARLYELSKFGDVPPQANIKFGGQSKELPFFGGQTKRLTSPPQAKMIEGRGGLEGEGFKTLSPSEASIAKQSYEQMLEEKASNLLFGNIKNPSATISQPTGIFGGSKTAQPFKELQKFFISQKGKRTKAGRAQDALTIALRKLEQ